MSAEHPAKVNGRRSKSTAKAEEAVVEAESAPIIDSAEKPMNENSETDSNPKNTSTEKSKSDSMSADNVVKITARPVQADSQDKQGAIQLHKQQPSLSIFDRPVMPSDIEVAETYSEAGIRPIGASHLQVYSTILNNRPISSTSLRVYETLPGNRPIFYSDIKMVEGELLPGDRPVMVSDPQLMQASTLPGNRPIASNQTDDSESLMGFID